jgi:3-phenylpropionate/trans-cinnamate dioxygenase ferredoxin reductase component
VDLLGLGPGTETAFIVGAGQAGGQAASALRLAGFVGRIVIAGDEPHRPYERPPLSKSVLTDQPADAFSADLHPAPYYAEQNIEHRPGVRVASIDPQAHRARLADGEMISFDCCLIATGGRARRLPGWPQGPRVLTLRDLADAARLRQALGEARHVAIVGGGFLGLEVASSAATQGVAVTVVEAAARLLSRAVPAAFATRLLGRHQQDGTAFHLGRQVTQCREEPGCVNLLLDDGEMIRADVCLVAVGQEPDVGLAQAAGLAIDNGISVDAQCRTSYPDIYAAGDCASFPFGPDGRRVRLESWQNANEQARCAAHNMLGKSDVYRPTPWFWTDQCGWNVQMLGLHDGAPYDWVERRVSDDKLILFGLRAGLLAYALAQNAGGDMRVLRQMMERSNAPDVVALADPAVKLRSLVN